MHKLKLTGILLLTILGIILIAQNTESVETQFLFVKVSMPRAVLLMVTMMIGICLGLFSALLISRRNPAPENKEEK